MNNTNFSKTLGKTLGKTRIALAVLLTAFALAPATAAKPKKAAAGTIRADFAESIDANAVHGSDAAETAQVEISFFFPGMNIYSR